MQMGARQLALMRTRMCSSRGNLAVIALKLTGFFTFVGAQAVAAAPCSFSLRRRSPSLLFPVRRASPPARNRLQLFDFLLLAVQPGLRGCFLLDKQPRRNSSAALTAIKKTARAAVRRLKELEGEKTRWPEKKKDR
jgi:hypothetical protein